MNMLPIYTLMANQFSKPVQDRRFSHPEQTILLSHPEQTISIRRSGIAEIIRRFGIGAFVTLGGIMVSHSAQWFLIEHNRYSNGSVGRRLYRRFGESQKKLPTPQRGRRLNVPV